MTHSNTREARGAYARPEALAILACLALFALMPEARRLVDWRSGFAAISAVSIIPLAALIVPLGILAYGGRIARIDRPLTIIAWLWFGGFTCALAVGIASGNAILSVFYTYAEFCLPAAFGLWVASLDIDRSELFEAVARFLLALATPISLYGMLQFAAPPAWDVAWMQHVRLDSIGIPAPFQVRPFSTLNGPGILADFLSLTILLNLPRLRRPSGLLLLQFAICGGALALTLVRVDWLTLVLGIACYFALSPNRSSNLLALGACVLAFFLVTAALPRVLGADNLGSGLAARLSTLTELDSDTSYLVRAQYYGEPLAEAAENPAGTGLGIIGTAAKLGDRGTPKAFDNGYVARLTEMGWFGTACYLAATFGAFAFVLARRSAVPGPIIAAVAAVQLALIASDFSTDHHLGLDGMFFWLSLAFVARSRGGADEIGAMK